MCLAARFPGFAANAALARDSSDQSMSGAGGNFGTEGSAIKVLYLRYCIPHRGRLEILGS